MPGKREENFVKKCNIFIILAQNPLSWGYEIYKFGRPFLGHN